jgi:hypothetical protein
LLGIHSFQKSAFLKTELYLEEQIAFTNVSRLASAVMDAVIAIFGNSFGQKIANLNR